MRAASAAASSYVATNAEEQLLAPLQTPRWGAFQQQESGSAQRGEDLQTKRFVFLSGLVQCPTMFSLVLT